MGPRPQCYIPSHKVIGPLVLQKIFEGFLPYMWKWRISWSCDPDPTNKLPFSHPTEDPYEIWLWLAQPFWRRSLKMVDRQWTDDRSWLYYKLTNEPKGSGELKMSSFESNEYIYKKEDWSYYVVSTNKASASICFSRTSFLSHNILGHTLKFGHLKNCCNFTMQFMDGWFAILRPIRMTEGWTWQALCNDVPFRFGKNLTSSGIRTRYPVIRSRERQLLGIFNALYALERCRQTG